jgi:hypothetical protein
LRSLERPLTLATCLSNFVPLVKKILKKAREMNKGRKIMAKGKKLSKENKVSPKINLQRRIKYILPLYECF